MYSYQIGYWCMYKHIYIYFISYLYMTHKSFPIYANGQLMFNYDDIVELIPTTLFLKWLRGYHCPVSYPGSNNYNVWNTQAYCYMHTIYLLHQIKSSIIQINALTCTATGKFVLVGVVTKSSFVHQLKTTQYIHFVKCQNFTNCQHHFMHLFVADSNTSYTQIYFHTIQSIALSDKSYHDIYSISQEICTRFLLCCALLWLYIDWFSHIHQAYFTCTVAI